MALRTLIDQDMDALLAGDWGETASVAGVDVPVFFETASDAVMDGMGSTTVPALIVKSSVAASEGDSVIYDGQGYQIIEVAHIAPDLKRLYLSLDARFAV